MTDIVPSVKYVLQELSCRVLFVKSYLSLHAAPGITQPQSFLILLWNSTQTSPSVTKSPTLRNESENTLRNTRWRGVAFFRFGSNTHGWTRYILESRGQRSSSLWDSLKFFNSNSNDDKILDKYCCSCGSSALPCWALWRHCNPSFPLWFIDIYRCW